MPRLTHTLNVLSDSVSSFNVEATRTEQMEPAGFGGKPPSNVRAECAGLWGHIWGLQVGAAPGDLGTLTPFEGTPSPPKQGTWGVSKLCPSHALCESPRQGAGPTQKPVQLYR